MAGLQHELVKQVGYMRNGWVSDTLLFVATTNRSSVTFGAEAILPRSYLGSERKCESFQSMIFMKMQFQSITFCLNYSNRAQH